ncbi:MAG: hypothetical protein U5K99_10520 [Anaerolineales bacterium]|nr:hypothetical protein [Anaerolineales bacterium]
MKIEILLKILKQWLNLQELGYFTTPVTIIDDHEVVGFDRDKLANLLEID